MVAHYLLDIPIPEFLTGVSSNGNENAAISDSESGFTMTMMLRSRVHKELTKQHQQAFYGY